MTSPPKKASHTVRNVIIAVAVIAVLIVAGVLVQSLTANNIHVTGSFLTIYYISPTSSGYFGQKFVPFGSPYTFSTDSTHIQSLTIDNNASAPGGGTGSLTVNSISIDPGIFGVGTVSPALPYVISPGSSVTLQIPVQSTDLYSGPLNYSLTVTY